MDNVTANRVSGKPRSRGGAKEDFAVIASEEFFGRERPIEYLVEGLVVRGQPLVIGGPVKSCKTLLVLDLAYSLASGTPFLGRFAVPKPARVVVFSGESGAATLDAKSRLIAAAKGVPHVQPNLLWQDDQKPQFPRLPDDCHRLAPSSSGTASRCW